MLSELSQPSGDMVAAAFGLGTTVGELRAVAGGRSHRMWRLQTTTGGWAVKQLNRSPEQWWRDSYLIAAEVELAAFRHGIRMPRPVHPVQPVAPLLAEVEHGGTTVSLLVHEWCDGVALTSTEITPAVLTWVGETLAALHSLPIIGQVADADRHHIHSVEEWQDWLGEATGDDARDFVPAVRAFLPDIERAKDTVDQARRNELRPVRTHRDVKPDNVLMSTAPLLLDWDSAGLDFAEWEATRVALAFCRQPTGWDRASFEQVMRHYRLASGRTIPPLAESFAGVLASALNSAAWMLWRALGHRPVTTTERASAYGHTLATLAELRSALGHIEHWTRWLAVD
jgi:hypothetical protein